MAHLLQRNGTFVITAAISPYRAIRDEARSMIKDFVEVFADAPLEVCEERDVKGLYAKARAGEIKGFTGIDDPYEAPENAEVVLKTGEQSPEESAQQVIDKLIELKFIEA